MSKGKQNKSAPAAGQGFSLFELILVLALIGFLTALLAPQISSVLVNTRLKAAAKKTVAIINHARSQAVAKKKPIWVVFDQEKNQATVIEQVMEDRTEENEEKYAEKEKDGSVKKTKTYEYPEDVAIAKLVIGGEEVSDPETPFFFYPNGSSSGGEILLQGVNEQSFLVVIDPLISAAKVVYNED